MIQQTSQIILYIFLWLLISFIFAFIAAKVRVSGDKEFKQFYNAVDDLKQTILKEYPTLKKIIYKILRWLKCK